ncbi:MAG: polyketide cyclase [Proteobacteria bacterium]|jgi:Activator of Hsp90 ATPase homolog 1-like protein|nr:polyketide cyclase [Pseudomonadota bacterium]
MCLPSRVGHNRQPPDVREHETRYSQYTDRFDDPNMPGTLEATVTLQPVIRSTGLRIEQAGISEAILLEMCYLGWQEPLAQLATLVEQEIPG